MANYRGIFQWTLTPAPYTSLAFNIFRINDAGSLYTNNGQNSRSIRPVVYLKPEVKIIGGAGTSTSPYTLAL